MSNVSRKLVHIAAALIGIHGSTITADGRSYLGDKKTNKINTNH